MNKRSLKLLLHPAPLLVLLILLTFACDRRELHVLLDEKVRVNIEVDWKINYETLYGDMPNGMTVMAWKEGSTQPIIKATNSTSVEMALTTGTYYLAVFNELREEYSPKLKFDEFSNYDEMTVRANSYQSSGWDEGVRYMFSPDDPRICVALDTIQITTEMLTRDTSIVIPYEEFINAGSDMARESKLVYEIDEITWPMTVDLYIMAYVKHRQSIKSIDGSISGLANGFRMSHINRTTETGALRFYPEMIEAVQVGEESDSLGLVTVKVPCFGLPYGKELLDQRKASDNVLTFYFTLINDSIYQQSFDVGKLIRYITPEGKEAEIRYRQDLRNLRLELDLGETIPVPRAYNAAGFDAKVDDWEDGGTIDIGL